MEIVRYTIGYLGILLKSPWQPEPASVILKINGTAENNLCVSASINIIYVFSSSMHMVRSLVHASSQGGRKTEEQQAEEIERQRALAAALSASMEAGSALSSCR